MKRAPGDRSAAGTRSFGSTYEGLKLELQIGERRFDRRFGSTYEGLKLGWREEGAMRRTRFGSTYEGLKQGHVFEVVGHAHVLAVPMRA